ncbi:MAG: PAS domain S-box protein [Balneolaceae bacterium]
MGRILGYKPDRDLQQEFLDEISQIFNEEKRLKPALDSVLHHLVQFGEFSLAEIWLIGGDGKQINLASSLAESEPTGIFYHKSQTIRSFRMGEGLPGTVWQNDRIEVWDRLDEHPSFVRREAAREAGLISALGLPLIHHDQVIGVLLFLSDREYEALAYYKDFFLNLETRLGSELRRKQLEEELARVFDTAPDMIAMVDFDGVFKRINRAGCRMLAYKAKELLGVPFTELAHPEEQERLESLLNRLPVGESVIYFEGRFLTKTGDIVWLDWSCSISEEEELIYVVAKDITEKKTLEQLVERSSQMAQIGNWELDFSEDGDGDSMYWSPMTREILEVDDEYNPSLTGGFEFYEPESRQRIQQAVEQLIETGEEFDEDLLITTARGLQKWIRCIGQAEHIGDRCLKIYGSFQDIHDHKVTELELEQAVEERNAILESIRDAFFAVDRDWVVTYWNREAELLLENNRSEIVGKNLWEVYPDAVELDFYSQYQKAMKTGETVRFEEYYPGKEIWLDVTAYPSENSLSVYFRDVSTRKKADIQLRQFNESLQKQARELELSNQELEQFAYVASHDLQEPLRMVTGFLTQLEKKYAGQLDDRARQYIDYAVDGARRMRQIILDLLDYSRVGREELELEDVSIQDLVDQVLVVQKERIRESSATIHTDHLPVVRGPRGPLLQVLHNLISNALKYHRPGVPPEVRVTVRETDEDWTLSVKDNGIGISEEYREKIYIIFQRLHARDEYPGSGIGLAIVKKIADNLGGSIRVDSSPGKGSQFHFTFPKQNR